MFPLSQKERRKKINSIALLKVGSRLLMRLHTQEQTCNVFSALVCPAGILIVGPHSVPAPPPTSPKCTLNDVIIVTKHDIVWITLWGLRDGFTASVS